MSSNSGHYYKFGPFRLDATERLLWRGEELVSLPPKAFDMLLVLTESNGRVLTKEDLLERLWPDAHVEEANLSNNIYKLREALGESGEGEKYIQTLPRRGYRFVAKVSELRDEEPDLLVEEHSRANIVIEEETSGAPMSAIQPQTQPVMLALPRTSWLSQNKATLLVVALVSILIAGASFAGRRAWLGRVSLTTKPRAAAPATELKITRVTNSGKVGTATISPDGRFIAYDENYTSGEGTLYVRQTGTNNEIRLLEPGERFFGGAAFSPDGNFIYYVAYEKNDPAGALYRIPVLGGPPTRLIGDFDSMFTLSPDGRQVTFYRSDAEHKHRSIMIASLDGGEERKLLSRTPTEATFGGIPAWSPDGSQIAFAAAEARQPAAAEGGLSLFAADVEGHGIKQLTTEHFVDIGKMNWAPDGKGLIFVALRPRVPNQFYYLSYPGSELRRITNDLLTYGNYGLGITADQSAMVVDIWEHATQLWLVNGDGTDKRQLTLGSEDGARGISSLADGRIAYVARTNDEYDIWIVKEDGTQAKPLTADTFFQGKMSATPDGRYLVFTSDRGGGSHLFRIETDGTDLKQLTFGTADDGAPDCSPDSKWVVYESTSEAKTTLWKVPIEGGAPIRLTDYESVSPSFSPDGQMISCALPAPNKLKQASIAIIPNTGGAPLRTFAVLTFAFHYNSPRWTPDGHSLLFLKTENHVMNLWRQPMNGNPAKPLTNFESDSIYDYSYTRDDKHIIVARGKVVINVAMIKHFL